MERNPALNHPLDAVDLVPVLDGKGQRLQFVQDGLGIGRRQHQLPLFRAAKLYAAFLLGQAHGGQDAQDAVLRRAEAHPFRVEGESLAVLDRRAGFDGLQQLGDGFDHIQPLLADEQHHLQPAGLRCPGALLLTDGIDHQADVHPQRALLRQRALHGRHQLGPGGCGAAADHLIHRPHVLTGHQRGHDMPARAVLLPGRTGAAMAGCIRRDGHLIPAVLHHLTAQELGALFRNPHPSGTEDALPHAGFFLPCQRPERVGNLNHSITRFA